MAARRGVKPRPTASVQAPGVADKATKRAVDVLAGAVQELQKRALGGKTVTGSRSSGAALESLLQQLAALGIIVDETTA